VPVVIRVPLIPGYNSSDENLHALAETVAEITKDSVVNLLPYHKYGANKYRMLDLVYQLDKVPELTQDELDRAKGIIESHGLKCEISK
jgi:pyruvate formate lyase activating enzyme